MKTILKKIYKSLPFKKEIYSLIRSIYSPPNSIYKHLHFNGPFLVNIDDTRAFKMTHFGFYIENEIFWNGLYNGWEKFSLKIWSEMCEGSEVILDIGANTGIYALIGKTISPGSKVLALEPVQRVFDRLVANVELNRMDIVCLKKAASNFIGTAEIFDKDSDHTYSVTVNKDLSEDPENSIKTTIETTTLDHLIEEYSLTKIDIIKIDVETHEAEVLEGFANFISLFQPDMLIEILNDEVAENIESQISQMNYLYFNIDEKKGVRQVASLSKSDHFNFLICKPSSVKSILSLSHLEISLSK